MTIDIGRREFITVLGGAAATWPLAVRVQQPERIARIGYLAPQSASFGQRSSDAFRAGLRDLGYVEGKNLRIEFRFSDEDEDRLPGLAAELVGLNVDVIVTVATGIFAAHRATTTIPIVQATGPDLVALGIVSSFAHPGGNVTGMTFFGAELMAKRLELLKEVVPSMNRTGVLLLRGNPSNGNALATMGATAKALKVGLQPIEVGGPAEFESAFSAFADQQIGGIVITDHAQFQANSDALAALAAKRRLPAIGTLEMAASGVMMGYGVNFPDLFRRAAALVDKILKGAKPGDIPIEQAAKFKMVLNLKTARALGIEVPTSLLLRADEVIE